MNISSVQPEAQRMIQAIDRGYGPIVLHAPEPGVPDVRIYTSTRVDPDGNPEYCAVSVNVDPAGGRSEVHATRLTVEGLRGNLELDLGRGWHQTDGE